MLTDHAPCAFVAVDEMERARAFYVETLGLEDKGFDGFAHRLRAGPIALRLVRPPQGRTVADYTVFGFETPDIARDVAGLAARGVDFLRIPFFGDAQDAQGVWSAPGGDKVAWFKDTEGNTLSLAQHAAG